MIGPTLIFLILSAIILESMSQFMARLYWENKRKLYLAFIGWALYLGVIFILVLMYDYSKIAIANALWDSGTIITLSLIGYFYFGEPLNIGEIAGIVLVIIGAITIGVSTKEKEDDG
jgi:small multidrug resistance pump